MRRRLLRTLFATVVLCNVAAVRDTFAQVVTKEAKETGAITGRVTSADEQPLQGIGIVLIPSNFSRNRKPAARALTGEDGSYRLANVPAGSYQLQLLAPGYTSASASMQSGWNDGRAINIASGETIEHQDFTLARGGVITGRVTDAYGKPVVAEAVRLSLANRDPRSDPEYVNSLRGFETDDRGVYRLYAVPAGRYFVSVGEDMESGAVSAALNGKTRARTFHPNATEQAQAKIVEVTSGSEATGVDITLGASAKTYEAAGRMLDAETGQPAANVSYGFGVLDPTGSLGHRGWGSAKTNAAGEFSFSNLMPGRYAVFAITHDAGSPNYYSDAVPFEIGDSNVSGIVVKVHRGATLSGVVTVEGTPTRAVLDKLAQASLYVHVVPAEPKADEIQTGNSSRAIIQPDGSFRVTGLPPGKVQITLAPYASPQGFTFLRIERGGVEQRGGIEIGAGVQVSDVRVRLAYGTSIVRGHVEIRRDGQPAQFPEDGQIYITKRRAGVENAPWDSNTVVVDARGHFILEGLVAGEYELLVSGWSRSVNGAGINAIPGVKQLVNVPEKGEINVTLIFDLGAKPKGATP
ncbi:MAG TPA: carboxypeptidase-like regulatory domain-containing protein [Pyrinomonadaceae bacterium]|nr:carboxypeptidase-like regulatory domain-containing protein [Pyrinomonadaceae bacterium]